MLKIMAIYSEMQMNIFNSQPIVIAKDVRYETVIEIETRSMMLPGMSIEIGTKRVYPRSNLASQIIGYTGAIPTRAMWLTLQAKGYSYNDTIGRDGIESSMEDWLTQNSSFRKGSLIIRHLLCMILISYQGEPYTCLTIVSSIPVIVLVCIG
mgnify:CR=1 FL=1